MRMLKRFFLVILLYIIGNNSVMAQQELDSSYWPFIQKEKSSQKLSMLMGAPRWEYAMIDKSDGRIADIFLTNIILDSKKEEPFVVNGKSYYKLYQVDLLYIDDGGLLETLINPIGVREEEGKVYAYYEDYKNCEALMSQRNNTDIEMPYKLTEEGEVILYDFTLQKGEVYPISEKYGTITVDDVETITTNDGLDRKVFTLSNGIRILEGVGCLNSDDIIFYFHRYSPSNTYDYRLELFKYQKDGVTIYSKNAITTGISVNKKKENHYGCFDLQGRSVKKTAKHGILIKDGRKVVR